MANLAREPSVDESKYCANSWERILDVAAALFAKRGEEAQGGANFASSLSLTALQPVLQTGSILSIIGS